MAEEDDVIHVYRPEYTAVVILINGNAVKVQFDWYNTTARGLEFRICTGNNEDDWETIALFAVGQWLFFYDISPNCYVEN